jgi:energy-coupling factor transport system ATP-binding protein
MGMALQALNVSYSYNQVSAIKTADTNTIGDIKTSPISPSCAIIEDITVNIADNEFTAIIGRNGSGKTTLLKNFTGLLRPCSGDILIRGKNSRLMSVPSIASEIGFVMQNPDRQLFCDTVYDEAAFALKAAKIPDNEIKRRVNEALAACGLSDARDAFPPALSRGDRAKTVIASVLAMGPKILIFDEPAGGQDFHSARMIMDIAAGLHRGGHTVIFVTHNMSLAAQYARRIIVMDKKRIVMDGTPREVFCGGHELPYVTAPQITRLSRELRKHMPLERETLTVAELGEELIMTLE